MSYSQILDIIVSRICLLSGIGDVLSESQCSKESCSSSGASVYFIDSNCCLGSSLETILNVLSIVYERDDAVEDELFKEL